eukprot:CAMPEP_0119081578 /NCGR_PEP_ID=MMETSP1178-20130426/117501_1 /TAXON_ID=33656 /ORGANISM="unid sp, Strain CCMP2000" /LENGTH=71 /DNA_ID=CAMNT_0007064289 /DNA_START=215 /DNA_END=427 /DNA_ORIENTATION=+
MHMPHLRLPSAPSSVPRASHSPVPLGNASNGPARSPVHTCKHACVYAAPRAAVRQHHTAAVRLRRAGRAFP